MTKLSKGLYDRLIHEDEIAEINRLIHEGRASVYKLHLLLRIGSIY